MVYASFHFAKVAECLEPAKDPTGRSTWEEAMTQNTAVDLTGSNLGSQEIIAGNSNWPLFGTNSSSAISTVVNLTSLTTATPARAIGLP